MSSRDDPDLFAAIDAEAQDDDERQDSREIYHALCEGKEALSASAELPADDVNLSERIHQAASVRSQEVRAASASVGSQRLDTTGAPVPAWMWVLWVVAVIGAGLAIYLSP